MKILGSCIMSIVQDFESYLRTEVDLVEDNNRVVSDEYNSSFITYEVEPGFYSFKDISKSLFNILNPEHPPSSDTIVIGLDDITRKTKSVVGSGIMAIRFDEKSVSLVSTMVGILNTITNTLVKKL